MHLTKFPNKMYFNVFVNMARTSQIQVMQLQ